MLPPRKAATTYNEIFWHLTSATQSTNDPRKGTWDWFSKLCKSANSCLANVSKENVLLKLFLMVWWFRIWRFYKCKPKKQKDFILSTGSRWVSCLDDARKSTSDSPCATSNLIEIAEDEAEVNLHSTRRDATKVFNRKMKRLQNETFFHLSSHFCCKIFTVLKFSSLLSVFLFYIMTTKFAQRYQFRSLSSKYLYSNVKPSFFRWPHFS